MKIQIWILIIGFSLIFVLLASDNAYRNFCPDYTQTGRALYSQEYLLKVDFWRSARVSRDLNCQIKYMKLKKGQLEAFLEIKSYLSTGNDNIQNLCASQKPLLSKIGAFYAKEVCMCRDYKCVERNYAYFFLERYGWNGVIR